MKHRIGRNVTIVYTVIATVLLVCCFHASHAQFLGEEFPGDYGLFAGTQDDPSASLVAGFDKYQVSKVKNGNGEVVLHNFTMRSPQLSAGPSIVTNLKILGANYGVSAYITFASNRMEGIVLQSQSAFAFTDMSVQPLQLGWHTLRADFVVSYNQYIPTGKYKFGADNNYGLGMWSYEPSAGFTVYLDSQKTWSFALIAFYEMHSNKKGTTYRVGDIFTVDGGLGKSIEAKTKNSAIEFVIGPTYYADFKATRDKAPAIITSLIRDGGKDRVFGLGGEFDVYVEKWNTALSVRWLGELGAQTRFEGQTLALSISQGLKSFSKSKH